MNKLPAIGFVHRKNLDRDGMFSSICMDCLGIVAESISESELERKEHAHRCDPLAKTRTKQMWVRIASPTFIENQKGRA